MFISIINIILSVIFRKQFWVHFTLPVVYWYAVLKSLTLNLSDLKFHVKHLSNILVYNSNKMHKSQSLFKLIIALHVSDVTITHLQEHKNLHLQHLVTITL
jgi:hypothetical protein